MWVLCGMLVFVIVEKVFSNMQGPVEPVELSTPYLKANGFTRHNCENDRQIKALGVKRSAAMTPYCVNNNNTKFPEKYVAETKEHYHISGYLNLMANSIDNFTHGLAIGGSFCISFKIGVLSTFAILVHEIPHEVGDFAILLK